MLGDPDLGGELMFEHDEKDSSRPDHDALGVPNVVIRVATVDTLLHEPTCRQVGKF